MPSTAIRQNVLSNARSVVIKLGTQLLRGPKADDNGGLDQSYIKDVARQVVALRERGVEVTLVSSGAIGAGCAQLGLKKRPTDVAALQAVAAVGQRQLMTRFHDAFAEHKLPVAQLLLTRDDFDHRQRFLNIRNCIAQLHAMGCVPIVNENDTVAVEEIRFGDNDQLSALLTTAVGAKVLLLLSVVDGLLDAEGKAIDLVTDVAAVMGLAREDKTSFGSGGMGSKLTAAQLVTEAGEMAVIANGRTPDVFLRLLAGERIGTLFVPRPSARRLDSRRRWIGLAKRPAGSITIDDGAAAALTQRGKSLLASGVTGCTGDFEKGQVVSVRNGRGAEVARGLTNYGQDELKLIMGRKSSQFEKILGHPAYAEVVHRDNLVLTPTSG
ncbi:MAG: glutamate 5-kinase [Phycisphaeraceae bacterium]|nr:glutamate 5-kinase [Phycisphaeraceae bacterium]